MPPDSELTGEQGLGFSVLRQQDDGADGIGRNIAMEVEGGDIGIGDFVEHAHGGVTDDVSVFFIQDDGLVLLQIVMAMGTAFDEPGGFEINKECLVIGRAVRGEDAGDAHLQGIDAGHVEGLLGRGEKVAAGL